VAQQVAHGRCVAFRQIQAVGGDRIVEAQLALSSRPEAEQEALAAGAKAFVSKTGSPEQVLAAVQDQ
jgi:DNA-binding NarL/FixJ family response regulator